ncbi:MAG: macro domain-containing protein [Dongiaceae bacterium]
MRIVLAARDLTLAAAWRRSCADLPGVTVHTGFPLQRRIAERHHGELLVGAAEIVETGDPATPWLIAAPTMRVPMILGRRTVNCYLATRAVLLLLRHGLQPDGPEAGRPVRECVGTVAFPGMGTGVGQVPAGICARQMRQAILDVLGGSTPPDSWADASERHQRLCTDRIRRLQ